MADPKKATADAEPKDAGQAEVQKIVDAENAQGFRGVEVDPTPNEHYTLAGVTAGLPTPETDRGAAKAADDRVRGLSGEEFPK